MTNVNWERDCPLEAHQIIDARNVVEGDPAPDGQGTLQFLRGIEVGHIFQLGTVYSEAMQAGVLDANGKNVAPLMGCYGMGVTRLVAAVIEQNHDDDGICWPLPLTPFEVHIIALNYQKSQDVREACDTLHNELEQMGVTVLLDDRDERPGVKFADADLIGLPLRVVIGDRGLKSNSIEYKLRKTGEVQEVPLADLSQQIKADLA